MPREFQSFLQGKSSLSTANRPLRLLLGFYDGNRDDVLLPQRVVGEEAVCGGIEYTVLCLSLDAALPLKEFIGVAARIEFVTDRGDLRSVCGIVSEARAGNSDGGLASYALTVRDAMALMDLRCNSRVFRNKNELEIIRTLFAEWMTNPLLVGAFELEIDHLLDLRKFPQREFTRQFNETDAHFVRRLLKRRGIAWFIRAGRSRNGSVNENSDRPAHTLVLFDGAYAVAQNRAGSVRFHRDNATEKRDTITSWCGVRRLRPGLVTRHSGNYRDPGGFFASVTARSKVDQGPNGSRLAASLDDYLVEAPHIGHDPEDFMQLGQLRMARHDYETKCFHGAGSVRDFCVGEYFTLEGHPEIDRHPKEERNFVITELRVHAVNNLPSDLAEKAARLVDSNRWNGVGGPQSSPAIDDASAIRSRNEFTAIRRGIRIVPAYDPRVDLPCTQLETAIVVGPEKEEVHCDRLGRVKIRFPSSRAADHEHARGAGTSGTDADSAYVRVASNWAGNGPGSQFQCGALGLPRIGSEVLVDCLGGDPDKPIIVGQLYNDRALPPGISDSGDLPGNRYLSGLRSREVGGSRANRLHLDDTPGQISAKLASDHGRSELNLGWLTRPRSNGDGKPRGEGAELRSEKSVAVRGEQGVLVSAAPHAGGRSGQLDRDELVGVAQVLKGIADALSKMAVDHKASEADGTQLSELIGKLKQWHGGTNIDDPAGAGAGGAPIVAVSAPAGALVASDQNVVIGAQSTIDTLSAGDTRIGAGGNLFLRTARGLSLFAYKLGLKLIAASGNIRIEAQNGDVEIRSLGRIKLIASKGIELQAPTVKIVAQGTQVDHGGGTIVQQSSGEHTIKSSAFRHVKGGGGSPAELSLPKTEAEHDQQILISDQMSGQPMPNQRYRITVEDGQVVDGTTDSAGLSERFSTKVAFARFRVELLD